KPFDLTAAHLGDDNASTRMNDEERSTSDVLGAARRRVAAAGFRSVIARTLILAGGWWALTEGDATSLTFGGAVVLVAVSASLLLLGQPTGFRLFGAVRLVSAFFVGSLRGGIDVAARALGPGLRLEPGLVRYPLRLAAGPARTLFMGTVNLM